MAIGLDIIDGDFVVNPSGSVSYIENADKCARDFNKMMCTQSVDSNVTTTMDGYYRYNPDYGVGFYGGSAFSSLKQSQMIDTFNIILKSAINNYIAMQDNRTNASLGETILKVTFNTYFTKADPSTLYCTIQVQTASAESFSSSYSQSIV